MPKTDELTSLWEFSAENNPSVSSLFNSSQIEELDQMFKLVDELPKKDYNLNSMSTETQD